MTCKWTMQIAMTVYMFLICLSNCTVNPDCKSINITMQLHSYDQYWSLESRLFTAHIAGIPPCIYGKPSVCLFDLKIKARIGRLSRVNIVVSIPHQASTLAKIPKQRLPCLSLFWLQVPENHTFKLSRTRCTDTTRSMVIMCDVFASITR